MQYSGRNSAHSHYASNLAPPTSAREELFYGSAPQAPAGPSSQGGGLVPANQEIMTNGELMQQAVEQHRDTTETTRRALRTVENMKTIQGSTLEALKDQGDQMKRVEQDFDKLGSELNFAQRVLRAMRVCCCVDILCPCLTEVKRDPKDAYRGRQSAPSSSNQQPSSIQMQAPRQQAAMQENGTYANPNTDGLAELGFGNQAKVIDNETQKQNQYLDEISKGLDQLKHGAAVMNEELVRQEGDVDRLQQDAQHLGGRLNNVNKVGFKGL